MTYELMELNESEEPIIARGKRLALIRRMANVSRGTLEKEYGISVGTMKSWELGQHTGLTEQGARRILTVFNKLGVQCSMGWLLSGIGSPPVIGDVPIYDAQEAIAAENMQNDTTEEVPPEIKFFCTTYPNAIFLKVEDDSSEPSYHCGDFVAGKRYYQEGIMNVSLGRNCIVETQAGEVLLRRVLAGTKEGYYNLQCINPSATHPKPYIYDVELLSAAPVLLIRHAK